MNKLVSLSLVIGLFCILTGGIQYRTDQPVRGFSKQISYNTPNLNEGVKIGKLPIGATPLSVRIIKTENFDSGTYIQMGFNPGGVEWTGYIYVDGTSPNPSINLTSGKSIETLAWTENISPIPLGASRELILKCSTPGTKGKFTIQVLYLD